MNSNYYTYLVTQRRSENTIKSYISDITQCLNYLNKEDDKITYMDLINWQASINDKSSATIARKIASVKSYFGFLKKAHVIKEDPSCDIESIRVVNKEKTPLTAEQIRKMIDITGNIRSKAIIILLASTGMRISEVINLTLEQFNNHPMIIQGKGKKIRKVYLSDETREIIKEYLKVREDSEYNNVFISNGGHPMQPNNISGMLKNVACKAGIENWKEISNHWFRTSAATLQSEAGQPIEVIQQILGHSNIRTTMRYVKVRETRLENAMTAQLF